MDNKEKRSAAVYPGWTWVLISLAAAVLLWFVLSINPKTARSFPFIPAILGGAKKWSITVHLHRTSAVL